MIEPTPSHGRPAAAGSAGVASLLVLALFGQADAASGEELAPGSGDVPAGCPTSEDAAAARTEVPEGCEAPAASAGAATDEDEPAVLPSPPLPEYEIEPPAPPPAPETRDGGVSTIDGSSGDGRAPGDGDDRNESDGNHGEGRDGERDGDGGRRDSRPHDDRAGSERGTSADRAPATPTARPGSSGEPVAVTPESPIPAFLLPIYEECGRRYGVPWRILAAINQVETAFGSNLNVSSAGAMGWMQFMPATWAAYGIDADGDGRRDPYEPHDAICAAASYLEASGARRDLPGAIFAYNHADWYVEMVLSIARSYAGIRVLDPLPPARRLDPDFARMLARVSRAEGADWALVLAVLRAEGERGKAPAKADRVREVAREAARKRGRVRAAFWRDRGPAPDVRTLARYNRAVGLRGLAHGMNAVRDRLAGRVVDHPRLSIYEGGRVDVRSGRIDPRVLALLLYLAESHSEVTVTSLISGHDYYANPGVPSAHAFGEAVDIAAIDGVPVLGNQQPGGAAERAVREILALPPELQPAQVISLFELGGPSFAAGDHHDHIHVGF